MYIFEFKLTGNGSAEDAINQIREKKYAAKYRAEGKKIVLIGSSFDEQTRTIKDWAVDKEPSQQSVPFSTSPVVL